MSAIGEFTGLPMPVFTAFGWAGEEAAIQFALSHLETFIQTLHAQLSPAAQLDFPNYGLNKEAQLVYLAMNREPEDGPYITFSARPNFLEMRLSITNRLVVHRGLRSAEKDPERWFNRLQTLEDRWTMQIEQRLIEEESGVESHYNDLFKDLLPQLDLENSKEIMARAAFLNGEDKWRIPMFFSHRISAMDASSMNSKLIPYLIGVIDEILPIVSVYTRKQGRSTTSKNGSGKVVKRSNGVTRTKKKGTGRLKSIEKAGAAEVPQKFSHETEIKPLHLRKGFINLTAYHWEFFSEGPRSETRQIILKYGDQVDKESNVWRLQPDNIARVMLSDTVQEWLRAEFSPSSRISISAVKTPENEIEVTLAKA